MHWTMSGFQLSEISLLSESRQMAVYNALSIVFFLIAQASFQKQCLCSWIEIKQTNTTDELNALKSE